MHANARKKIKRRFAILSQRLCGFRAKPRPSTHTWRLPHPPSRLFSIRDEASVFVVALLCTSPIIPLSRFRERPQPAPPNAFLQDMSNDCSTIDRSPLPIVTPPSPTLAPSLDSRSANDDRSGLRTIQRTIPSPNRGAPCSSSSISPRT